MTVIGTGISWTNSTWNLAVGCDKISAGCANCYASAIVSNPYTARAFGHAFEDVRLHPKRLADARKFKALTLEDGTKVPHLVFANSMSDFWHDKIPDDYVHQALDTMEKHPDAIFQVLTKRPARMRRVIVDRYGNSGVPANIWLGVSVESNDVAARIRMLRTTKERTGGNMTAFLSVEPIVGPTDKLLMDGMDWVITGGESGGGARVMERRWLLDALEAAQRAEAAIWHKQSGQYRSHPNIMAAPQHMGWRQKFNWLVANGYELLPEEKGGATVDGRTYRAFPPSYHAAVDRLSPQRTLW